MKDYHNLYLKCGVSLLTNLFEIFRNSSLKNSALCPSHYLNSPSLSWDAMLTMKTIVFELMPDPNMYIFFKKGFEKGSRRLEFLIFLIGIGNPTINF